MARISSLARSLTTAASTVRPIVLGTVGRVTALLPGRSRVTEPSTPETFTPSPAPARTPKHLVDELADSAPVAPPTSASPSPASIARNVAAPRPSAKQPSTKPRAVPGAKLPARRANPST